MVEIRFNYGDKFTQTTNTNTGIGSTIPAAKLDIAGGTSAGSLRVSGIATLSSYQGFVNTKLSTTENLIVEAGQSGSVSGEVVIGTGQTTSVSTGATTGQGGIQSLKVYGTFMPPVGGTADRPTDVKPGMLYYNKDFKTIEFWDGNFWKQVDNTTRRGRGLLGGGQGPSPVYTDSIGFINISTFGDSQNFGDLTQATTRRGCSSSIRGLFAGGFVSPTGNNTIEYVTIASEGDAIDFGDMTHQRRNFAAVSSSTRGIWSGGESPATINVMDYIEIATIGNSLDFGDLMRIRKGHMGINSAVRGIWVANQESGVGVAEAEVISIASKGNSVRFGAFSDGPRSNGGAASNPVKGIYAGGYTGPAGTRTTQVFSCTIASDGNFINFTDLPEAHDCAQGMSNSTRGVFMGGYPNQSNNTMKSVEFASGGESVVFGKDLASNRNANSAGISDSHGGLGGF